MHASLLGAVIVTENVKGSAKIKKMGEGEYSILMFCVTLGDKKDRNVLRMITSFMYCFTEKY